MPAVETVTIINKSGKVISTGKQLVSIFKDARDAYQYKKAELRADHQARIQWKNEQRLLDAQQDTRSTSSSRRSHRSRRPRDAADRSRPPLANIKEDNTSSSRRSRSHHGSRRGSHRSPHPADFETPTPGLQRRHSEAPTQAGGPPPLASASQLIPLRAQSNPDLHADSEEIDMNLAYGKLPPDLLVAAGQDDARKEQELQMTMTKLDSMLMEAHCVQHSATAIISNLQANPEAMAAVALTLAELSSLLKTMSPGILTALKSSSPAVFGLLASPQFLIAGGVAIGVTVVMFGGYKIIKKIQANAVGPTAEVATDAIRMETAMVYEGTEVGSIETWRRGIADAEEASVATSVDGEFITPEAARQKKERIRERRREERSHGGKSRRAESVVESVRSERPVRKTGSEAVPPPPPASTSSRTSKSRKSIKEKEEGGSVAGSSRGEKKEKTEKKKKGNTLSDIFKRGKEKGREREVRESVMAHRPRIVEL